MKAEKWVLEQRLRAWLQFRGVVLDRALELLPTLWGELIRPVTHFVEVRLLAMVEPMGSLQAQG